MKTLLSKTIDSLIQYIYTIEKIKNEQKKKYTYFFFIMFPLSTNLLKSKIFYFSLVVLLSSVFVNYYVLNVDYDVNYDWSNGGKLPPAPVFNLMLWVKNKVT